MRTILLPMAVVMMTGCNEPGPAGPQGLAGPQGPAGKDGAPGPAGKDVAISGSRLRAQYLEGDDGAREFVGWLDSMLDVPCKFRKRNPTADLLCHPDPPPLQGAGYTRYFSDAACSVPLLAASYDNGGMAPALPPYVDVGGWIKPGAAMAEPGTFYYPGQMSTCVEVNPHPDHLFFFVIAAEIKDSSLVVGSLKTE